MKRLNAKVKALLLDAIKMSGTYKAADNLPFFEEALTLKEAETVERFLDWVSSDEETLYFGTATIDERYEQYRQFRATL